MAQMEGNKFAFITGASPVAKARNDIVETFLGTDCTHLWMVDNDTIPPKDALEQLLAANAPVATGITNIMNHDGTVPNIFKQDKDGLTLPYEDFAGEPHYFEVDACGASCLLIRRDVLAKMDKPWFAEMWGQDGKHVTEDIFFCNSMRDQDIPITVAKKVLCQHAKTVLI